jgi:hypothetical protein
MRNPSQWLRALDHQRDALGAVMPAQRPPTVTYYRWPRWRGSVNRIADLALLCGQIVGANKPVVTVHWSRAFALAYSPSQLKARVEEDRLSRARRIEVSAAGFKGNAVVRLCHDHGEPGADLTVTGARAQTAAKLRDAVELGEWRPWSAYKLAVLTAFPVVGLTILVGVVVFGDSAFSPLASALASALPVIYLAAFGAALSKLMPPLEIRPAGSTAASGVIAWFFPGLPAFVAIAGLVLALTK